MSREKQLTLNNLWGGAHLSNDLMHMGLHVALSGYPRGDQAFDIHTVPVYQNSVFPAVQFYRPLIT